MNHVVGRWFQAADLRDSILQKALRCRRLWWWLQMPASRSGARRSCCEVRRKVGRESSSMVQLLQAPMDSLMQRELECSPSTTHISFPQLTRRVYPHTYLSGF